MCPRRVVYDRCRFCAISHDRSIWFRSRSVPGVKNLYQISYVTTAVAVDHIFQPSYSGRAHQHHGGSRSTAGFTLPRARRRGLPSCITCRLFCSSAAQARPHILASSRAAAAAAAASCDQPFDAVIATATFSRHSFRCIPKTAQPSFRITVRVVGLRNITARMVIKTQD